MLRTINHRSRRRCPTLPPKACRGLRPTGSGEVIDRNFQPGWKEVTECNFHGRIRVARVAQWTCKYVCGSVEFARGTHFQSSSYHRPVLVILQSSSSDRSFLFISKEVLTRKGMIRTAPDLDGMCIAVPHVVLYMPQHWWRATPWIRTTNKYNFETGYG